MHPSKLLHFAVLFPVANALTYWISPTCTDALLAHNPPREGVPNDKRWQSVIDEIRDAGESGSKRLSNNGDIDFARAFNYIFSTNEDDPSRPIGFINPSAARIKLWLDHLQGLGDDIQIHADVRIYCDNDDRWVPKDDGKGWKDVTNHMSSEDLPHCRDETRKTAGVTYSDANEDGGGHNPERATITLCKRLFDAPNDGGHWLWKDIPADKDFAADEKSIYWIRNTVTGVLAHELAHTTKFGTDDINGVRSYGWGIVVDLMQKESLENAENWMYIVIMSMFLDRGFALNRDDEAAQQKGLLVHYDNVSMKAKRWISRVNRWMFPKNM